MKLSEEIKDIFSTDGGTTSLKEILGRINQKSFGFLLVILSLPSALPVPAPGYSTPFAIAIFFIALGIIKNKNHPTLPKKILNKEIKTKKNSKMINGMVKFISFFEKFLKPRYSKSYHSVTFKRVLGLVVLLCGISMMIPIPLTNTIPAMGIFLIGLGMLEEDFLFALLGTITAIIGISFTVTIIASFFIIGPEIIDIIKDSIKSFLGI